MSCHTFNTDFAHPTDLTMAVRQESSSSCYRGNSSTLTMGCLSTLPMTHTLCRSVLCQRS